MNAKCPCFGKGSFQTTIRVFSGIHNIIRAFSLQRLVKGTNTNPSGIVPSQIWYPYNRQSDFCLLFKITNISDSTNLRKYSIAI